MILLIMRIKEIRYMRVSKSRKNIKSLIQIKIKKVYLIIENNIVKEMNQSIQIN